MPQRVSRRVLFREVNERIRSVSTSLGVEGNFELFCECARVRCLEQFPVPATVFDEVRASGDRFLVVPGHELEPERVVGGEGSYRVVSVG